MLEKRMDDLLSSFLKDGPRGCSCSVVHRGETVYDRCFGYRDRELKIPMDGGTLFRVYSMTKVITAAAALMLYERGKFLMGDPLSDYLAEFKDMTVLRPTPNGLLTREKARNPIRIKDLFGMTSGLCYGDDDAGAGRIAGEKIKRLREEAQSGRIITLRDYTAALSEAPLAFEPGTRWRYGTSHDVLGALIEVLADKPFEDFLQDEIFRPLGMENSFFRFADKEDSRLCAYFKKDEAGQYYPSTDGDFTYYGENWPAIGGAGLLSTLGDYQKFASMMAQGGIADGRRYLAGNTIDMMRTNILTEEMRQDYNWAYLSGYGYGYGVRTAIDRGRGGINTNPGEFGWSGYLGTFVLIDPDEQLSIVYMQQLFPNREEIHQPRIRSVVYGALC